MVFSDLPAEALKIWALLGHQLQLRRGRYEALAGWWQVGAVGGDHLLADFKLPWLVLLLVLELLEAEEVQLSGDGYDVFIW